MKETCPTCGEEYKVLGNHWSYNPNHRPELTQKQLEISIGMLMGDGWIVKQNKNDYLSCGMIVKEYLEYIDDVFGILGCGVKLYCSAEENAERSSGFVDNPKGENYSDVYQWQSRCHPQFNELRKWYESGSKVWPDNIELTPTVLKHWYCGDGSWDNIGSSNRIVISMSNEINNTDKVEKYFERVGLPKPSNYNISERDDGSMRCSAHFTVEDSKKLWEYMGDPVVGFEYKWPEEYR